jgi:hypothetical protein
MKEHMAMANEQSRVDPALAAGNQWNAAGYADTHVGKGN